MDFSRRTSEPLGILPQLPITMEGKTVCIDVLVVQGHLDFNLIIGRYYVYDMKYGVSTLFRVMHFPHDGNIVTIYQLLFISPNLTFYHLKSLNVPYIQVVSPHHRLIMWKDVPCLQLPMIMSLSLCAQLLMTYI
jgi:hypothetical protein